MSSGQALRVSEALPGSGQWMSHLPAHPTPRTKCGIDESNSVPQNIQTAGGGRGPQEGPEVRPAISALPLPCQAQRESLGAAVPSSASLVLKGGQGGSPHQGTSGQIWRSSWLSHLGEATPSTKWVQTL